MARQTLQKQDIEIQFMGIEKSGANAPLFVSCFLNNWSWYDGEYFRYCQFTSSTILSRDIDSDMVISILFNGEIAFVSQGVYRVTKRGFKYHCEVCGIRKYEAICPFALPIAGEFEEEDSIFIFKEFTLHFHFVIC